MVPRTNNAADPFPGALWDPQQPSFRSMPYPMLHRLRDLDPVHCPVPGQWVLSRYQDVVAALQNPSFGRDQSATAAFCKATLGDSRSSDYLTRRVGSYDPPLHTRLRGILSDALAGIDMDSLHGFISKTVDGLLAPYPPGSCFDAVSAVADPLPSLVISHVLGIPSSDQRMIDRWTRHIAYLSAGPWEPARLRLAEQALIEEWSYMAGLLGDRSRHPVNGLLGAILPLQDVVGQEGLDTLIANIIFLYSAGYQSMRDQIGSGLLG